MFNPFDKPILKVYGPYLNPDGDRRYMVFKFEDGKSSSMSYARWLMTQHLQRRLAPDEHVDHINDNSLDDRIENYQLLTPAENNSKSNLGRPSPLKGIEKGWTHGTTYGWIKKKCRCVECDKARLKFYKERNAKRKAENKSKLTESNRQPRSAYKGPCPHGSFRSTNAAVDVVNVEQLIPCGVR